MDMGGAQIASIVVGSTSGYFETFSPIFLLIGGLLLAFVVLAVLASLVVGRKISIFDDDEDML